jgi:hypothetical protein
LPEDVANLGRTHEAVDAIRGGDDGRRSAEDEDRIGIPLRVERDGSGDGDVPDNES